MTTSASSTATGKSTTSSSAKTSITTPNVSQQFAAANRGALTTIFTPPASCLTETTLVSYLTNVSSAASSFTTTKIFINHYSWGDTACYPALGVSTVWSPGYYYSPGICPSGWTSACEQRTNAFHYETTISTETSAVICCPSNWACVGGTTVLSGNGCSTVLTASQTMENVWLPPNPTPGVDMPLPTSRNLQNYVVPSNTSALCNAIPVLWQSTDLAIIQLLASITNSPSASKTGSSSIISTSTSPPLATDSTVPSSGLSSGAKAAIGVIIPLVFIALVAGIFFFFRRHKKRQAGLKGTQDHHELASHNYNDLSQKDDHNLPSYMPVVEADADHTMAEMHGEDAARHKIPARDQEIYELSSENNIPVNDSSVTNNSPPVFKRKSVG